MKTKDSLTEHYMPLLEGSYDCIDRIVLNAYCPMLLRAGGLRNWYRIMEGSDEGLSDAMTKASALYGRKWLFTIPKI